MEYEDGLKLQALFQKARAQGQVGDALLLLEHPPVLTLGRGAKRENILGNDERLAQLGVDVFETNRGGDVTYHGPGQVVGYPILQLLPGRQDVRRYVRDVEECVIRVLARFGLAGTRIPKWPGVWLGSEEERTARKVGAIGVHISRWLTSHGFALNVSPDLGHFQLIVPCGIREASVTSMALELGRDVSSPEVETALAETFSEVFGLPLAPAGPRLQTVSVVVVRETADSTRVLLLRRTPERGGFEQIVTGRCGPDESPLEAAGRELREETGLPLEVSALGYRHTFALGETLPPRLVEEEAFVAHWPQGEDIPVQLGPEHNASEWVTPEAALERLPFAGLKAAIRRAVPTVGARRAVGRQPAFASSSSSG